MSKRFKNEFSCNKCFQYFFSKLIWIVIDDVIFSFDLWIYFFFCPPLTLKQWLRREGGCPLKNNEVGKSLGCSLLATVNCLVLPGIDARRPAAALFSFFIFFVCGYDSLNSYIIHLFLLIFHKKFAYIFFTIEKNF